MQTRTVTAQEHNMVMHYYGKKRSRLGYLLLGASGLVIVIYGFFLFVVSSGGPEDSLVDWWYSIPIFVRAVFLLGLVVFSCVVSWNPNVSVSQLKNRDYRVADGFCRRIPSLPDGQNAIVRVYDADCRKIARRAVVSGRAAYDYRQKCIADFCQAAGNILDIDGGDSEEIPVLLVVPYRSGKRYVVPKKVI